MVFRPLAGCGLFLTTIARSSLKSGFRPLAGCGLFRLAKTFGQFLGSFRPLAGCGVFRLHRGNEQRNLWFPSPCGVWVVSECAGKHGHQKGFRPLAGCGLFPIEERRATT